AAALRRAHATLARVARSDDARARHLGGATEGRHENVAAALEAAAAAARDRGATLDASALYERAGALTPEDRPADALRRSTLAADCLLVDLSEPVQADAILERAVRSGPPGPARAEALSLRALTRYYHGDLPAALALADQAVAEAGGSSPADRAARVLVLGRAAFVVMQVDLRRGQSLVREGLELGDGASGVHPDVIANLLLLDASATFGLIEGLRADEIERGRRLLDPNGRSWEHDGVDGIDFGLARATDDLDRAIEMTQVHIGRKAGPGGVDPFNLVMLSELQLRRGDVVGARVSATAADEGYAREGADVFPAWRLRGLAFVAAHDGRHDEARRWSTEGLALAAQRRDLVQQLYHHQILGFVALVDGDARTADAHLSAAAELALAAGTVHPGRFKLDGDRIEAALALGDHARAGEIVERLEHVNDVAPTPWTRAIGARGRGSIQAATGDLDGARASLERALHEHDALPMPFERARTLLALGQVHRRRKEKRLADERLREAISMFEALEASAWAARARAELGRVGRRPVAVAELTDTEQRVASLAATGLTAREIGEMAFLAPKTVGNVLGRVYQKLGIHSRAELGARLGGSAGDRSG
ncbi:MAG TPA: LuxR C-terminal-related transcriptional regulator, partial [Candidatus Limnocylindrales bacterium]|nr:LuxR C-terminal-related transcriptional regulator [Candidatus Limnocylindrales bacterium]